ncbi:hypothetical protein ALC57_05593 [Trachymyrmex cornetzi]|uniref:Uncharacterized protein n=1 Tax=Trachymyrmex cornetzi TaxID=471704 RepID=A0A151JAF3_9HYME|nr:hypothetical protein ALC57_05593 [Trachymyrmex cornetzi]
MAFMFNEIRYELNGIATLSFDKKKEIRDSLLFLDVFVQNCRSALAKDSHKISNFLGMICRLHNEGSSVAQLMTTLHSKSTLKHLFVSLRKNCNPICIFGDIMLNSNSNELHRKIFLSFVTILPSLLLKPSVDDVVIRMNS